jgi:hypothetical protein
MAEMAANSGRRVVAPDGLGLRRNAQCRRRQQAVIPAYFAVDGVSAAVQKSFDFNHKHR